MKSTACHNSLKTTVGVYVHELRSLEVESNKDKPIIDMTKMQNQKPAAPEKCKTTHIIHNKGEKPNF